MATETIPEIRPLVTREQAIASGEKRYFTGEACSRGHIAERNVNTDACIECSRENAAKWRESNPERAKAVWTKNNHETRDQRVEKRRQGRVVLCPHCQTPIPAPTLKPGATRASRPKYCSKRCKLYSKVDKTPGHGPKGDCWVFTGAKHIAGYGMINKSESKASDITTSHAYSWELENGPIPDGEFVLHKCDFPPCVRPDHLFLGNHQDNMDDMNAKGRWSFPLPLSEIREIKASSKTNAELAVMYGCGELTIWRIRTGRTHKDV
jgi:HNH endonuclease